MKIAAKQICENYLERETVIIIDAMHVANRIFGICSLRWVEIFIKIINLKLSKPNSKTRMTSDLRNVDPAQFGDLAGPYGQHGLKNGDHVSSVHTF